MRATWIVASLSLATSVVATPVFAGEPVFRFQDAVGSQPFRSTAGAAAANTVAGVAPGGAPWIIKSFRAEIDAYGNIRAAGKGLLLGGADGVGTRGGPRQVALSLFCRNPVVPPATAGTLQTAPYNSPFVDLDVDGNFRVDGTLKSASDERPPASCGDAGDNRPVLLIRTVTAATATAPAAPGAWFAAGLLKSRSDEGKGDRD